jgi:ribosomal protein S18 acetylase RimI-like enzyme
MQIAPADSAQLDGILDETYPIWGEGLSLSAYRSWNRGQMATRWGRNHLRRLVLTDSGAVLASAKRYDFEALVGSEIVAVMGIGAVFTPEALRGRGHARALVDLMIRDAEARGCRYALLFSEIGAAYYESMGFRTLPRAMQSVETVRKPGPPATFVRSGETTDLTEIADINRRYRDDASFGLVRSPELIEFSFSRRRLQAGLGPAGRRTVEFFVSEEGHRPVAYVFITRGPGGMVLEECGDRDPAGVRVGSMLQVLASRAPAETPQIMTTWLPPGLRPPQVKILGETPAREIMMIRPIAGAPDIGDGSVVYWSSDTF